jgi:hypothetical protein
MKKITNISLMLAAAAMLFACSSENDKVEPTAPQPTPEDPIATPVEPTVPATPARHGAYVLSSRYYGENNASIEFIDFTTGTVETDLYTRANGERLGDSGQDLLIYGSKIYCTVSTSSKMVIMDKNCKVIKPFAVLDNTGNPATPRYMTAHGGKVYFTAYDGTVSRLDTATMKVDAKVSLGVSLEGITNANGKLYVNQCDYGNGMKVAVIDIATFTKVKDIYVELNPYSTIFTGNDGMVYLVSNGNYAGDPSVPEEDWVYSTLQQIDPATDQATSLCPATFAANYQNDICIIYSEYYLPEISKCVKYNIDSQSETSLIPMENFKIDGNLCANSINIDPATGDIYVCCTPWGQFAVVKVFDKDGNHKTDYTVGYCASKVIFTE